MSIFTEDPRDVVIDIKPEIQSYSPHYPLPKTLVQATMLAIKNDMPILLDYYISSYNQKAFIGIDKINNIRILAKSSEEYTSNICNIYKVDTDFIIVTDNSIYIVHGTINARNIYISSS